MFVLTFGGVWHTYEMGELKNVVYGSKYDLNWGRKLGKVSIYRECS
jgi:hypothetical protein